ncbi:MAG: succinate dehydrogenase/fumarate reductase cytochrome b subunit [Gammaproteobacteria bacterium]|jgi:succinate dehydrogenase/fumarate reductase cytochrome b subunit
MGIEVGLLGLIVLVIDIWAILSIASSGAGNGAKALWIVLILFLPVLGVVLWALLGPKS